MVHIDKNQIKSGVIITFSGCLFILHQDKGSLKTEYFYFQAAYLQHQLINVVVSLYVV
ncbi:hypothetical protein [Wielerella bovis]|uniref:hypothetical protein n=1 Tax=Wielerella bovis TaxID=2917790 RepID=UPI002018F72B|nr:hypothetical protein [Wielerella bovis]ULJ64230.1 hypothetical protein MIS33_08730 [Wielerella bovis]ULJ67851.1 hypothetical protein MIS31_04725 [Wielerella bovis]